MMTFDQLPERARRAAIQGASVANTALTRTMAAVAARINYATGFDVTVGGATAGSLITVTVTGLEVGTLSWILAVPTGATASTRLEVKFPTPLAGAVNTAVSLNVPAAGAGSTAAQAQLYGFVLT